MQSERFVVKYITVNNCFVYLSHTWLRKVENKENVVQLRYKDQTFYASCVPRPNLNATLCLGAAFARCLNISEGDEVFVSSVKSVPSLTKIHVAPLTANDREILELQLEKVQSTLLGQIRVVSEGQPIVAWVSKFSHVTLIIESLEPPVKCGLLEQLSEVHVTDAIAKKKGEKVDETDEPPASLTGSLFSALRKLSPSPGNSSETREDSQARNRKLLQSFRNRSRPVVYRVHPMPRVSAIDGDAFDATLRSPYHAFVPRNHAPKFLDDTVVCRMRKIPEDKQRVNATGANFLAKDDSPVPRLSPELTVRMLVLEDLLERSSSLNRDYFNLNSRDSVVYLSDSLRVSLNARVGARVSLVAVENPGRSSPSSIELFSWNGSVSADSFQSYVESRSRDEELLINSGAAIILDDGRTCVVNISPESCPYAEIDGRRLKEVRVHARSVKERSHLRLPERLDEDDGYSGLGKIATRHLERILKECQLGLNLSLGLNNGLPFDYDIENILISGETGSGRTTLCKVLAEYLRRAPFFVHTHTIDCRSLKGKKAETLQKMIANVLTECVYHQPAVLFLDDLEAITNASANDEENTPDAVNAARITDMLINMFAQCQETHRVAVIATSGGVSKIGQKLRPARGRQFFRTLLSIPNLEKADRIDILQLMLGDKLYVPGDVNWDYYGNKTEGWMVQDLVDMAEKAAFAAWKRQGTTEPPITIAEEDTAIALKNCTPMSLQGVQLYKGEGHVWSDIGGLADVKRSLVEILQWPLKYPEVFKSAPIKLQNGVLLYGMPGTGKTLLAKAIANECGVNLISVKGPELLSKYIGVSEESVRNVFERALRAKPCVLFFDEFDSLAPRRGHDSTGVTDRVVNQLLTQMDGVEDREGVAVVAASSRPDLLDPALLRPGRLDKALYCPLPDQTDREEILSALCRTQKMSTAGLDLKELAVLASGLTGADLNAVVTQARLSAFEDAVANSPNGKIEAEDIKVAQTHLIDAVKSTHPSLSNAEKERYGRIYARFAKNDNFVEEIMKNQKSTLA